MKKKQIKFNIEKVPGDVSKEQGPFQSPSQSPGTFYILNEEWKDVVGYKGLYQVSNLGRVKNIFKYKYIHEDKKGYCRVTLSKNNKKRVLFVHRLVAEAFIFNESNKPFVNHKDCNPRNNTVTNLEWCTPSQNVHHAIKNNRRIGMNLNEEVVIEIRNYKKSNQSKIAKMFGVTRETVNSILNRRTWKHV